MTLSSLRADALRLALPSIAIVLGVAFIAGTLMVTDGMRAASYERVGGFDRHTDVAVRYGDDTTIPPAVVDRVRAVEGVRAAEGEVLGGGGVVGRDGRPVPGFSVVASVPADAGLRSYDLAAGRFPERTGEAVLDTRTVERQRFTLGEPVRIGGEGGAAGRYTLVGVVDVAGGVRDYGGAYIGLTGPDALAVTGADGYSRILLAARPGVSDTDLAAGVRAVVGAEAVVRTHRQLLDDGLREAVRDVGRFQSALLAFAAISVLVAAFVIANTFTIVLAQRTRRTALLRLLGATRGQVFRSALLESALTGLVASLAGVAAGVGIAAGVHALLRAMGTPIAGRLTLTGSGFAVPLVAGVAITVGAALAPVWRGTRVPPVAALTDAAVQPARGAGWVRLGLGAAALALGVAALVSAGATGSPLSVAAGGVFAFAGIVLFGPVLVPALVRLLGWPVRRVFGAAGGLAVANAVRNPRRVSATATALVIGVGLVAAFVVGAQSTKAGIERSVDNEVGADYVLTSTADHLPATLLPRLRALPQLSIVHEQRTRVSGGVRVAAAHPVLLARMVERVVDGDVARLRAGAAVVDEPLARERGLRAGSRLAVGGREFTVAAVVVMKRGADDRTGAVPPGHNVALPDADFAALFPDARGYRADLDLAAGVTEQAGQAAVDAVVADYPTVSFMDLAGYKKSLTGTVDTLLGFVTALLGLAVVIALVGVANTLTLSVLERTRENALLRAVGLTRTRMRVMLAVEAVLISLVGALLGIGLGTAVSAGGMGLLNAIGGEFAVVLPWDRLGVILAVAIVAALAASVLPARRAVRRPVVEALGTE
ncbi:ABC transporter permease [Rhizomonospora bruguierae]|uniref:ABC transporter permease n=1 Tax=Rhizomonospora bruguierae TaxID=1581705 RepID=UPI001BCFC586|nr:ABC transporter permease [Micromonospora sp. NBRC 107566]